MTIPSTSAPRPPVDTPTESPATGPPGPLASRWTGALLLLGALAAAAAGANQAPVAHDQRAFVNQDESQTIWLELEDDWVPGPAQVTIVEPPAEGDLVQLGRREFSYTPRPGFFGVDRFRWRAGDGELDSGPAQVSIGINARPVGLEQEVTTVVETPVEVALRYDDPDGRPGPYSFRFTALPDHGEWAEVEPGRYRYTPGPDHPGTDAVWWKVHDGMRWSRAVRLRLAVLRPAELLLTPRRLSFYRQAGDPDIAATVTVANDGEVALTWTLHRARDGRLIHPGGQLAAGASVDVPLRAGTGSLPAGVYEVALEVRSEEAVNAPQRLDVLLRVEEGATTRLGISQPDFGPDGASEESVAWLADLGVKYVRTGLDWAAVQPDGPDAFDWSDLESKLAWGYDDDWSILLQVASTCPDWVTGVGGERGCVPDADHLDAFRAYVAALATRLAELAAGYPNGLPVDKIQFGNEWDNEANGRYPGTAAQYVEQLRIVGEEMAARLPELPIVLGGLTMKAMRDWAICVDGSERWDVGEAYCESRAAKIERLRHVLASGAYDVVDQHLYWDREEWPLYLETLRLSALPPEKAGVPVIASEFGGPETYDGDRDFDDAFHAEEVAAYVEALRVAGVSEAYYFSLVEPGPEAGASHAESGLVERTDRSEKPGYFVFRELSLGTP